jgi:universal stress protein A
MFKPTKILVPTDFSEHSDRAFLLAIDIAKQHGAKVFLLHVIHEEIHRCRVDYCLTDEQMDEFKATISAGADEGLRKQAAKFPEAEGVDVVTEVKNGIPYEIIVQEEKNRGIDLIVMGSLGRTGLIKYLLGSVAQNVLKSAKCPVLLTK